MRRPEMAHDRPAHTIMLRRIRRKHAWFTNVSRGRLGHRRRLGRSCLRLGALAQIRTDSRVVKYRHHLTIGAHDIAAIRLPRYWCLAKLGIERVWVRPVFVQKDLLPRG